MKTNIPLLLLLCLALSLCTCSKQPPQSLTVADALINTQPDSAIVLLKTLKNKISTESEATRMYYQLLCIKANDKAYIPHTSDSLILTVLHYYTKKKDKIHLPEAYYYAGRVYRDLEDAPQALAYFQKALEVSPQNIGQHLKSRIYSQMGTLFLYQRIYNEALKMFKEALICDLTLKDSTNMVFDFRDIADAYQCINCNDSSLHYFQKAHELAKTQKDDKLIAMIQNQIACLYTEFGKYDLAKQSLQPSLSNPDIPSKSSIFSIAAELYYKMGNIDSATYYYNQILECGTIYAKQIAHEKLAEIAINKNNLQETLSHLRQYKQSTDSIYSITDTETILQLNSLYNYQLHEKENNRLKMEHEQDKNIILITISAGIIVIALLFAHLQYHKRVKLQLDNKIEKLKQLKEEQYRKSEQYIENMEMEKRALEQKLQEADKENNSLRIQLEEQIETTIYAKKQAEKELDKRKKAGNALMKSAIYEHIQKQLHTTDSKKLLSNNDWRELENTVNSTYKSFTESLYKLLNMTEHEYHVCLLIKINIAPIDIARLTIHSKEAIASTRRRLYKKVFCKNGTPKGGCKLNCVSKEKK